MHDSITSCADHLKNIGSLSYSGLPSVDTFYYAIKKFIFPVSPRFQKPYLLLENSYFIWQKFYQQFSLNQQATVDFTHYTPTVSFFEKMPAK